METARRRSRGEAPLAVGGHDRLDPARGGLEHRVAGRAPESRVDRVEAADRQSSSTTRVRRCPLSSFSWIQARAARPSRRRSRVRDVERRIGTDGFGLSDDLPPASSIRRWCASLRLRVPVRECRRWRVAITRSMASRAARLPSASSFRNSSISRCAALLAAEARFLGKRGAELHHRRAGAPRQETSRLCPHLRRAAHPVAHPPTRSACRSANCRAWTSWRSEKGLTRKWVAPCSWN
jgi:hypothetical protein